MKFIFLFCTKFRFFLIELPLLFLLTLSLIFNDMAPGETHTYTITMYCKYTYGGDVYADAVPMSWRFSAKAQTAPEQAASGMPMWLLIIAVSAGAIAVGVGAVVAVNIIADKKAKNWRTKADDKEKKKCYYCTVPKWDRAKVMPFLEQML